MKYGMFGDILMTLINSTLASYCTTYINPNSMCMTRRQGNYSTMLLICFSSIALLVDAVAPRLKLRHPLHIDRKRRSCSQYDHHLRLLVTKSI